MVAERAADQVQGDRIHTRVRETQTEPDDAQHVPESVVLVRGPRIVVKPQHEHVMGQETHGERQRESQHGFGHLFPRLHLTDLSLNEIKNKKNKTLCKSILKQLLYNG